MIKIDKLNNKYEKALYYEIFKNKEYSILDEVIKNWWIIFDVWWHIWLFSLYSLSLNSSLTIHYFEPVKEYFNKAKNILEDFEQNIIFNNYGILDKSWESEILINNKISSQTSIYKSFLNKNWAKQKVIFQNIWDYIQKNNIESIDLLKMDIEWAEFDVLLNLDENIFPKIKVLFLEYHILNIDFESKYNCLLNKIKTLYQDVNIIKSIHSNKLWYIFAYNILA